MSHGDYVMISNSKLFKFDLITQVARVHYVITYAYNSIKEKESGIIVNSRNIPKLYSKFAKQIVNL